MQACAAAGITFIGPSAEATAYFRQFPSPNQDGRYPGNIEDFHRGQLTAPHVHERNGTVTNFRVRDRTGSVSVPVRYDGVLPDRDHYTLHPAPWVAGMCDRGIEHARNEDALALAAQQQPDTHAALVVCDGVTTAAHSDVASLAAASLVVTPGDRPEVVRQLLQRSVYEVLERELGVVIHHGLARFRPVRADSSVAGRLGVPRGELLLYLWQVDYAEEGTPVISSHEFHLADAFDFTVVRRGPGRRRT